MAGDRAVVAFSDGPSQVSIASLKQVCPISYSGTIGKYIDETFRDVLQHCSTWNISRTKELLNLGRLLP